MINTTSYTYHDYSFLYFCVFFFFYYFVAFCFLVIVQLITIIEVLTHTQENPPKKKTDIFFLIQGY